MQRERPQLVVSDRKGKIFNIPYLAVGMKAGSFFPLALKDLVRLPQGSELFMLPSRKPVGYDTAAKDFVVPDGYSAVAAFVSPGHTITYNSAYIEDKKVDRLPLFSYGAVAFYKGEFYVTALRVDREPRQDIRFMDISAVKKNAKSLRKQFSKNRLFRHLEACALCYGCPAAKNLFLKRYEAPLPTSPSCNSRCIGCISYQPGKGCPITQPRIKFVPTDEEISEVALYHIRNVKDPVVSFGQGCEGEPLLVAKTIERAIRLIRKETKKGIINLNTNASKPDLVRRLSDAGLDSIRVSLNSVQELYYNRYYKPRSYRFKDVISSIRVMKNKKGFVSVNYLIMPGFTDSKTEFSRLKRFISKERIDMIQLRNLNIDPIYYIRALKFSIARKELIGIKDMIVSLKSDFPHLMLGYFNPSRTRVTRTSKRNI
ncbi:MAG: radical SAM protein [Candidatus Omnitrophica bacterium]|nr:radical SAM protein [Candidatus Omnitrophota bacterium]